MLLGALFPRPSEDDQRQRQPEVDPRSQRVRRRAARADPLRSAHGTDRPGPEPLAAQHGHRRRGRATSVGLRLAQVSRVRAGGGRPPCRRGRLGRGRGGRAGLGRRGGQPLDPRGGRGQGPAPLLPLPRQVSQLHRDPPGQRPQDRGPLRRPSAVRRLDELSHARADRAVPAIAAGQGLSRAAAGLAGPFGRPADGSHAPRPALCLGGNAAADPRRAGPKGPREPARLAHRLGRSGRRRQRLHRQRAAAMPAPHRPLVRGAQHAPQRHAGPAARRAAAVEVPAPAQHRHAGGRSRCGPAGPAHPQRGLPELRGHLRGGSTIAAAAWPG